MRVLSESEIKTFWNNLPACAIMLTMKIVETGHSLYWKTLDLSASRGGVKPALDAL